MNKETITQNEAAYLVWLIQDYYKLKHQKSENEIIDIRIPILEEKLNRISEQAKDRGE